MSLFTPFSGALGGTLIGGSAGALLLLNGDIMGISGILSNTLTNPIKQLQDPKNHWRYVYLASFSLCVNLYVNYIAPKEFLADDRAQDRDVPLPSTIAYMLGGLLVGLGTRLGNGCTTGHGICGIARFSKRSLIGTATFTGFSMLTTYMISPLRSWASNLAFLRQDALPQIYPVASGLLMAATVLAAMISPAFSVKNRSQEKSEVVAENNDRKVLGAALSGSMFAAGLAISGMTKKSKVHDFLCLSGISRGSFDPTLVAVLGSGIFTSWLAYQFVKGWSLLFPENSARLLTSPLGLAKESGFSIPTNTKVDAQLLLGTAAFGVGWGLDSVCPGPALFAAASGNMNALACWLPMFSVGSLVGLAIKENWNEKEKSA